MAIGFTNRKLPLPLQALGLRHVFPEARLTLRPTRLIWEGVITPTPLSRAYTVRISYASGEHPRVVVKDPPLEPDTEGFLPHYYREGRLCLYQAHQWDESMYIANTIIPWTAEWLAHYELWKRAGHWYGDGPLVDPLDLDQRGILLPVEEQPRTRRERRRHAHREAHNSTRRARSNARHERAAHSSKIEGPALTPPDLGNR